MHSKRHGLPFKLIKNHGYKKLAVQSCYIFVALISLVKTHENLHKNVNENEFSFTFLCNFSCICNFAPIVFYSYVFTKM